MTNVTVCRPSELSPAETLAWRELQASDSALDNAFLSVEFASAIDRCVDDARVAVARHGEEIVAFLAFQRGHLGIGRALGLGISDAQAVICEPGFQIGARDMVRSCGIGLWEFDHLVSHFDEFAPQIEGRTLAPVMDIRGGYESYLRESRREERRLFRSVLQKERKLEREHGEIEFVFDSTDALSLDTLLNWKSAQYDRSGAFDRFSRPWIRALINELAASTAPSCRGVLSTLSVGGRLIAAHFGIRNVARMSLWFPAYDPEFGKYSPGLQLFYGMARSAPEHGIGLLDLGKGDEPFKRSLASWYYPVAWGRVRVRVVASLAHSVRVGAGRIGADLVMGHPRLRNALPRSLSHVDRVH